MKCDCGAVKAQTQHYHWCSSNEVEDHLKFDFDTKKFPHKDPDDQLSVGWENLWIAYDKDGKVKVP